MYKRLKVKLYPTKNQIEMLENHFDGYKKFRDKNTLSDCGEFLH